MVAAASRRITEKIERKLMSNSEWFNQPPGEGSWPIEDGDPRVKPVKVAEVKDSNPKDAVGTKKAPMSTVSAPVMMEVGVAMLEGALKYGRHNYRAIGVRASVYYDALQRHIMSWWEGEDVDEESGLSHVTKAIACMMVLRDAMIRDKVVDDRPPGTAEFVRCLNNRAANLIEQYPNPKDAFVAEGPPEQYQP